MNVIGVLVNTLPEHEARVAAALAAMSGVEVHAASGDGRLVVTATDGEEVLASESLMAMSRLDHVIVASLVYHAVEPDTDASGAAAHAA